MRPSLDETMLEVARCLARRATCTKLSVGCVLVDIHGRIIGSGYNGVPRGMPHCISYPCAGADMPSGSDTCEAVHAEQNALLACRDVNAITTAYITHAPCLRCVKMLLNTSCRHLVLGSAWGEPAALDLWTRGGGSCYVLGGDVNRDAYLPTTARYVLGPLPGG